MMKEPTVCISILTGLLAAAMACLSSPCAAQSWIQLAPSGGPPSARYEPSGVYDAATNQMIIFGGGAFGVDTNDLWTLSLGASPQWTLISPAGTLPAPRIGQKTVYDPANSRMILFGGGLGNTSPCGNDVWVLSNANGLGGTPTWTQLSPTGPAPAGRYVSSAIYDAVSNRMTVFGGNDCFSGFYNDVWVLSNANGLGGTPAWTQLAPTGTPPDPSGYHSAVYDPGSNRMVVFGVANAGSYSNQVWVLTNANGLSGTPAWIQLFATGGPIPARLNHAAVYDVLSNRMTVFGGFGTLDLNDVWVLANANGLGGTPAWTQLSPSGTPPAARDGLAYVYDPATNRMTIFGGATGLTYSNDAWVLTNANGISYAAQVQPPINADGSSVFNAKRGVVPVKFTLTLNGAPTCQLPPATIGLARTAGAAPGPIDQSVFLQPSDSGSNFRIDSCQYIYNLATASLGLGTYLVQISISGNAVGSGTFGLQ